MSVAESIVIRFPILQFGCARACFGVALAIFAIGVVLNGPPDAVSTRRLTSLRWPARRHWWMALCSLSTGRSATLRRFTAAITISPAATRTSLLASAMDFPNSIALYVAGSPTTPTAADTTISTSGWVATRSIPSAPKSTSGSDCALSLQSLVLRFFFNAAQSSRAPASVPTDTTCGRYFLTCSATREIFWPAARDTTWNSPGSESTTWVLWRPIEPVEPSIAIFFMWVYFMVVCGNMRMQQQSVLAAGPNGSRRLLRRPVQKLLEVGLPHCRPCMRAVPMRPLADRDQDKCSTLQPLAFLFGDAEVGRINKIFGGIDLNP